MGGRFAAPDRQPTAAGAEPREGDLFDDLTRRLGERALQRLDPALSREADPALFTTRGGDRHCVVSTGDFDLLEASAETRRRQVALFSAAMGAVSGRFQVCVHSRADAGVVSERPGIARFLASAGGPAAFRRQVSIVLSDGPAPIDRLGAAWRRQPVSSSGPTARAQAEALARGIGLMGPGARLLEGRDLDRFLDRELPVDISRGFDAGWTEEPGWIQVDGRFSRTFVLTGFPGGDLEPGWLAALLDTPIPYQLAIHGFRIPVGSAMRLLNRRIRDLQASRLSDAAGHGVGNPVTEAGLPEALALRRDLAVNQGQVFSVAVYLSTDAADPGALDAASALLSEAAERGLLRLAPATFQMAPARLATMPLGFDPVRAERLVPGDVLASLFPWVHDRLQQPQGHFVGWRSRRGGPVLIDTFDEAQFANANVGVLGHSGAGKTFLVKGLLLSDADAGIGGFVIDPESEYRDVCEAIGGEFVDLALGSGTAINVLDPALSVTGERDPLGDQVADLLDLLGTMCGSLGDEERVDLDLCLRTLLVEGTATLGDLRDRLVAGGTAPRVARSLKRWTAGPMGQLFSRPTNVALDADFVVFSLRDLKEDVLPVAYFLIAQWIWARVRADPRPRRLLFDEVGLVFEYPLVRRFLVRLARRVRKYQGSLVLVTQNAGDLLASDQGLVLATNPSTLFLGAQRPAEAQRLQRAFGLTEAQVDYISAAGRGEFLLLAGDRRHRIRVAANPWQVELAACATLQPLQEERR